MGALELAGETTAWRSEEKAYGFGLEIMIVWGAFPQRNAACAPTQSALRVSAAVLLRFRLRRSPARRRAPGFIDVAGKVSNLLNQVSDRPHSGARPLPRGLGQARALLRFLRVEGLDAIVGGIACASVRTKSAGPPRFAQSQSLGALQFRVLRASMSARSI